MTHKTYLSVAETAKLLRKALKAQFPGQKFSVRSKSYAGGASIRVSWTDGPSDEEVKAITDNYTGADFDGMIDLKTYNTSWLLPNGTIQPANAEGTEGSLGMIKSYETTRPHPDAVEVRVGADYVFTEREYTKDLVEQVAASVQAETGWDYVPEIASYCDGYQFVCEFSQELEYENRYYQKQLEATSAYAKPESKKASQASAAPTKPELVITADDDWTWIQFSAKPVKQVRDLLKALGARWDRKAQAWYINKRVDVKVALAALATA